MELEGFSDISPVMRAGVYALVRSGQVVYVGKSKSLYARIYAHRNLQQRGNAKKPSWMPIKGVLFDEVYIRPCLVDDLDTLEREMIERYKPKLNVLLKTDAKISTPINIQVGDVKLTLNADTHLERRI